MCLQNEGAVLCSLIKHAVLANQSARFMETSLPRSERSERAATYSGFKKNIEKGVRILEFITFYQNALHLTRVHCDTFYQSALRHDQHV